MKATERIRGLSKAKRRAALAGGAMAAIAGIGMTGVGGTSALFTSTAGDQAATFNAGTVVLDNAVSSGSTTCVIGNLAPGTVGTSPTTSSANGGNNAIVPPSPTACSMKVSYDGTLRAWILLDVSVTSTSATAAGATVGGKALFNGGANGLQLSVLGTPAGSSSFTQPGQVFSAGTPSCTTNAAGQQSCTSTVTNQLVGTSPAQQGGTGTFELDSYFPLLASNAYQGGSAKVTLTAHAVQYDNNHASDCSNGPCFVASTTSNGTTTSGDPMVTSESVKGTSSTFSGPSTVQLVYDQTLATPNNLATGPWGNIIVTDLTQSSSAPVTCPVAGASLSKTTLTDDTLNLTLGACSNGATVASGDWLSIYYTSFYAGSGQVFLTNSSGQYVPTEAMLAQAS